MRNLITDVPGVAFGHAQDARLASGATAIVFDRPAVAAVDVRGGAPGTRETDLLDPGMLVEHIDAIAFSGGSGFGLDTAGGGGGSGGGKGGRRWVRHAAPARAAR